MKLLLDTQLLLWALTQSQRIPPHIQALLLDPANLLCFSSISIWEIAIKQRLGQRNLDFDADQIYQQLFLLKYQEHTFLSSHAIATRALPMLHKDPFDRALLAQATVEGMSLVTADATLGLYPGVLSNA